jgi:hypothetical protein
MIIAVRIHAGIFQESSRIGNAGETACATIANQQSAAQVGQAFSLPGLLLLA